MPKPLKKPAVITNLPHATIGGVAVARVFSVSMLVVAIVVIGALFYQVMASFFVPLFLAALLVVIFRPVHEWILMRVKGRQRLASALATTFILLLVLLPAGFVLSIAAAQGTIFIRKIASGGIKQPLEQIRTSLSLDLPASDSFRQFDEDLDSIESPYPFDDTKIRIEEARSIVQYLQAEVGATTPSETAYDNLLTDLQGLEGKRLALAEMPPEETPMLKEAARQAYDNQYQVVKQSRRLWIQSMLGTSLKAQLKMLANPSENDVRAMLAGAQSFVQPRVLPLTQVAGEFLLQSILGVVITVITLYFFFADGSNMIQTMMRLSPLDDEYERQLLLQFDRTSRAVVLASVLSALAQGTLAAIAFWFADLPSIVLLFIATTFMALVPFFGAASVWIPCVIYLAAVEQRVGAAIALGVFGVTVISSIDNVIKVLVLQGHSQLHPLLALLSVLGGLQVFGPIGILVGPMVVVFLQTLLEILNHELEGKNKDAAATDTSIPAEQI